MKANYFMIVTAGNWLEVWSVGYASREKAQERVDTGFYKKYMYPQDKNKKLVVISHQEHIEFKQLKKAL